MESQAKKARVFSDDEIRRNITQQIKQLELPVEDDRDLEITRYDDTMEISLEYEEVVYIPWGDEDIELWVFKFNPVVVADY